ncbi:MAG: hypothetical protein IT448_00370 [Phycisphaerales bacterium]|nr:hypothetical protein [Phycisphaerales bacterium]
MNYFVDHKRRVIGGIAGLIIVALAGLWLWNSRNRGVSQADLRRTQGIELQIKSMQPQGRKALVQCQVENRSDQPAASVVMTIELVNAQSAVVGSNPLANVLNLHVGEKRDLTVPVPFLTDAQGALRARGRVELVRWKD